MNLGMLKRAISRHRYAKNRYPYTRLLEHLDSRDDVWKAPQREIASWWEQRQAAAIALRVTAPGSLSVSCGLEGAVVELDGGELRVPPFDCSVAGDLKPGSVEISYHVPSIDQDFAREVLRHLGYGHVSAAALDDYADVRSGVLDPLMKRLREAATVHQRFGEEDLAAVRSALRAAHRARGLPELRLWTLPHRGGKPYRAAVSPRFDVDKAIVNMPLIHELEARHGMRSTAYVRPLGPFYEAREIRRYASRAGGNEIALHGEFLTSARRRYGDELKAAAGEKQLLEYILGHEVDGVCMHGGELSYNFSQNTRPAIEAARFRYETMYRNSYYLPLHLPSGPKMMRTLSIGQHFADLNIPPGPDFADKLVEAFLERFSKAEAAGGVFVPVMHPLYFDLAHYASRPENLWRLAAFAPRYLAGILRMRRDQDYINKK